MVTDGAERERWSAVAAGWAELWGGFAAAYGRLYFMAEDGLYALGDKTKPFPARPPWPRSC